MKHNSALHGAQKTAYQRI